MLKLIGLQVVGLACALPLQLMKEGVILKAVVAGFRNLGGI
jgi:hypothetical protein